MLVESVVRTAGAVLVPAQDRPPPPGQLPEFGNSSPVGLVVVLLLLLATVVLIRSMSKRIRRLPASFDEPGSSGPAPDDDRPAGNDRPAGDGDPAGGERAPQAGAPDDRAGPRGG